MDEREAAIDDAIIVLYRAVKPDELIDIQQTGQLINRGLAEGKYFSITAEGAASYARQAVKAFGDPPYTLVTVKIPRGLLIPEMIAEVDRGIATAVLPDHLLELLMPRIESQVPIPH